MASWRAGSFSKKEIGQREIRQMFGIACCSSSLAREPRRSCSTQSPRHYHQPIVADDVRVQALLISPTPCIALPEPSCVAVEGYHSG